MSGETLLDQQRAAIERRGSVGLSAGAGCGKTFVLIRRFLEELDPARLSEPGPHGLGAVVAITFTDKAAREMRDRLREAFRARSGDPARRGERSHWRDLLRRADAARVSTIHGFCSELLRGHAAEAGLDPAFAVVEGADEADLKTAAVDAALKTALAADPADDGDRPARDLVSRYGLRTAQEVAASLAFGDPDALARDFTLQHLIDARAAAWEAEHVPRLMAELLDDPNVAEARGYLADHPAEKPDHARGRAEALAVLNRLSEGGPPATTLGEIDRLCAPKVVGNKNTWPDEIAGRVTPCLAAVRRAAGKVADALGADPEQWEPPARLGLAFLPLARDAAARYAAAKRAGAQLDNDDLLRRGRDLLANPAVRGRVAGQIRLLMVDEFQDTDPVQADLVRRLTVAASGEDGGRLFLVGDAKQSIYRFRGADPSVFGRVRESLPEPARLPLTKNFRSRPELLRFVNATFDPAIGDYEPLEPPPADVRPVPPAVRPCVEFLFPTVAAGTGAGGKVSVEDRRREEAAWIAARVRQLIDSREPCVRGAGGERAATPGDFCLLFRTLSSVRLYEEALREQGLEYYLTGGQAFFAQQEVHDFAHLLLWLDDPDDTLSLAGALRSPLFSLSDDTLFSLVRAAPRDAELPPLSAAVLGDCRVKLDESQSERLRHARAVLAELIAGRDRLAPGDLLDLAVSRTGYDAAVSAEFLGDRKLANLRKLQALARRQTRDATGPGLRGFAARLLESVERETKEELAATRAEAADVVRLMTVHKAKGLEFPVVVACDLDRKSNAETIGGVCDPVLGPVVPLPGQIPLPKTGKEKFPDRCGQIVKAREAAAGEAEEVRVFYVAATRAADRLILAAGIEEGKEPVGAGLRTLAAAFDLDTGEQRPGAARSDAAFVAPPVLVHREKPAAAGRARREKGRGVPIEQAREAVAGCEPAFPFDLRRPVPPAAPDSLDVRALAYEWAAPDERAELHAATEFLRTQDAPDVRAFLPPDLPPPAAKRVAVRVAGPAGGPALTGSVPRLHRTGDGWLAVGAAAATAAEVAADGPPDRLAPLLSAWRRSLDAAGGGDAAVLLVAADGSARLAWWDKLDDAAATTAYQPGAQVPAPDGAAGAVRSLDGDARPELALRAHHAGGLP